MLSNQDKRKDGTDIFPSCFNGDIQNGDQSINRYTFHAFIFQPFKLYLHRFMMMLFSVFFTSLFVILIGLNSYVTAASSDNTSQWPLHDNGLNTVVQWDHYSFLVNGERLFLFAGEFHYWRYPVPELWQDLLLKIKAAGFNAFSIYAHWGYHSPSPRVLDFSTGAHNFTTILTYAKSIGLYVLFRPGPYVNAESNAGGFPLWLTTGAYGTLRNNDSRYTEAWEPYFSKLSQIVSEHLITKGGNVIFYQIENELGSQWEGSPSERVVDPAEGQYMAELETCAWSNGIDVPLTANAPNMNTLSWLQDYSDAPGNVDVVGLDSYPSCWSCNLNECTSVNGAYVPFQVVDYYDYFLLDSSTQPSFMPEFQGGSYNPWGGPEGGCPDNTGSDFANLFYRHNLGQRVTAMSLYMLFGGTSWGSFAAPVVATSYDYSGPISENRLIADKFYETKLLALFLRVAKDLTATDMVGNSTSYSTNKAILTTELRNPITDAGFYVTIHANSSSSNFDTFKLNVTTSIASYVVPRFGSLIALNGHQSKIIVTDFQIGSKTLLYSTAEVLTYAVIDSEESLVLWLPTGESGEFSVKDATSASVLTDSASSNIRSHLGNGEIAASFTQQGGMIVLKFSNGLRVIIVDRPTAYRFWAPTLSADPSAPVNETILVHGPYLVRSVEVSSDGSTIELTGDIDNATTITVFGPKAASQISWNGAGLSTITTASGSLVGNTNSPDATQLQLPALTGWKAHDSLPERRPNYNDSGAAWVDANDMTTPNPTKPATLPVLFVDQYGFHNGVHLWRGLFDEMATGVYLTLYGGTAFGYSAWLNGEFIGSFLGASNQESASLALSFSNATVYATNNLLLVVQDNTGHDETTGATNPRGIFNATLLGGNNVTFSSWRVAGTAGGESNIDPVRGALAEGGLYAERVGWHLPGYKDSQWNDTTSPAVGKSGAGINFYRTVVPLDIPAGLDVSLSLVLSSPPGSKLRAQLFVGGYQYGRYVPWVGNQVTFPVPPGILNYQGNNTIALAVWAQSEEGASVDISWKVEYIHDSSYDMRFDSSYLRPGWSSARHNYD